MAVHTAGTMPVYPITHPISCPVCVLGQHEVLGVLGVLGVLWVLWMLGDAGGDKVHSGLHCVIPLQVIQVCISQTPQVTLVEVLEDATVDPSACWGFEI